MNLCRSCEQDFSSVRLFDAHRIGKHDYLATERTGGRRCLSREEMLGRGWAGDARGRWQDPARVQAVRETVSAAA
jgi:hypothetical protein